jgi:hypothetical protein
MHQFVAGAHGPVEFPADNPLPNPKPNCVYLASNYRTSSSLPMDDRAFLARKTATELLTGSIERITRWQDVAAILPLFVVTNAAGKKRIIFDARALNRILRDASGSVKYESVRDALVEAAVCTKLDVASAFRHVSVTSETARYMCFEVEGVLYRYKTLPFGVAWSPALFYKALEPTIRRIRASLPPGTRLVWYVDDLLIIGPDVDTLDNATALTIDTLLDSGWSVSAEKTYPVAHRAITFLGLTVDYTSGAATLRVPLSKARMIRDDASTMASAESVHVHSIQKLAGRLEFTGIVLPQVGLLRRGLDAAVRDGLRAFHGVLPVTGRLHADLLAIAHAAETFHEACLQLHDSSVRRHLGTVYGDASAVGWGVIHLSPDAPLVAVPPEITSVEDIRGWTAGDLFTEHERTLSSGARELRAIHDGINALDLRSGDVAWHSDATVAVSAISRWRSRSDDIVGILKELWDLLLARDIRLSITHVLRDAELMPVADWLSRRGWRDRQAEWGIATADVARICFSLGLRDRRPTADLFASARNAVIHPFCSRWAEVGSIGDAFSIDWGSTPGRLWWAFPPISMLPRICHRLLSYIQMARRAEAALDVTDRRQRRHPRSSASWSVILIYPTLESPPSFLHELCRFAARDVLVHASDDDTDPHLLVTAPAVSTSHNPVCPGIRLVAGDRPAPGPPPWPMRAALFHVRK